MLQGELLPEDKDFKNTKKLTWLSALPDELYKISMVEYDVLINKAKVEENDEVMDLINVNSKFTTNAYCTKGLQELREGVLQLERRGFYKIDQVFNDYSVLIFIPDGKTKQMSTISSKVDPKKTAKGSEQQKPSKKLEERARKKNKQEGKKEENDKVESEEKLVAEESKSVEVKKEISENIQEINEISK